MALTKEAKLRRRRLLRETHREVTAKVVALSHADVVALSEVRRAMRLDRSAGARPVVDLLGSVLRALCFRETVRIGGVLYVRADELLEAS